MTSIIQQQGQHEQQSPANHDDYDERSSFNPIPSTLPNLKVIRVATNPDLFILKNFMNPLHCNALIQYALEEEEQQQDTVEAKYQERTSHPLSSSHRHGNGRRRRTKYDREPWCPLPPVTQKNNNGKNRLRPAYTTNGEIRYNSKLCWIRQQHQQEQHEDVEVLNVNEGSTNTSSRSVITETAHIIAQAITDLSSYLVLPRTTTEYTGESSVGDNGEQQVDENPILDGFIAEDLQIVRYTTGGSFELHHDASSSSSNQYNIDKVSNNRYRFVTCLTYLNGVGGTWFPFATNAVTSRSRSMRRGDDSESSSNDNSTGNGEDRERVEKEMYLSNQMIPGRHGLWIVGSEVVEEEGKLEATEINNNHIIRIQPGDAIVFFNYTTAGGDDGRDAKDDKNVDGIATAGMVPNWRAEHLGMEVPTQTKEKWIATNWFGYEQ